jgi:hypothetical protein
MLLLGSLVTEALVLQIEWEEPEKPGEGRDDEDYR